MSEAVHNLIVIGAGISGLSVAAHLPKEAQLDVLCIEARSRLGGRAHTETIEGHAIDLGCSWVHMVYGNPLSSLAHRLKLDLVDADTSLSDSSFYDQQGQPIGMERSKRIVEIVMPLLWSEAEVRAQEGDPPPALTETLGDWVRTEARKELDQTDMRYVEQLLRQFSGYEGASVDDLSLFHWGAERGFEGPDKLLLGGYGGIVQYLHRRAQLHSRFSVSLDTVVKKIRDNPEQGQIEVETESGEVFRAEQVVVTVPIGVLQADTIAFEPALPLRRRKTIQRIGAGILNKLVLVYDTKWLECGKSAQTTAVFFPPIDPLPKVEGLFLHVFASEASAVLVAYVSAVDSPDFEALTDQEVTTWAHAVLSTSLARSKEPSLPVRGFVTRWRSDPYSRCAYSYLKVAQAHTRDDAPSPLDFHELSRPLWAARLKWAGEATEIDHFSYAHSAFLSGQREAHRIAAEIEAEEEEGT